MMQGAPIMTQNTLVAPPATPPLPPFQPPKPSTISVKAPTFLKEMNKKFIEGKVLPSEIQTADFEEIKYLELSE